MISYHCPFFKGNSYKLFRTGFTIGSVHFNLEMFPDDPLLIHYSKTTRSRDR